MIAFFQVPDDTSKPSIVDGGKGLEDHMAWRGGVRFKIVNSYHRAVRRYLERERARGMGNISIAQNMRGIGD